MKLAIHRYIVVVLMLCGICQTALAERSDSFFIFGDSLSDVGNVYNKTAASGFPLPVPPQTRYYQGRFSNGPNAADIFWQALGNTQEIRPVLALIAENRRIDFNRKQAINFAFGGSDSGFNNSVLGEFDVTGLLGQVGMFRVMKTDNQPREEAIALLWSGGNDYFNQFGTGRAISADQVVGNIGDAIRNLYAAGLRHFIVPNLPDLGEVPIAHIMASLYGDANIPGLLSAQTGEHNQKLNNALQELRKLPKIKVHQVDIYALVKAMLSDAALMPGPAAGCLYSPVISEETCSAVSFEAGSGLVFWDEIHPTTQTHKAFADAMLSAIKH